MHLLSSSQNQTSEKAQQAFSSSTIPTLCNAVPALEKMYMTWEKQRDQLESAPFQDAIYAAMAKINEYYVKTAESDAHIMAMSEYQLYLSSQATCSLTILSCT